MSSSSQYRAYRAPEPIAGTRSIYTYAEDYHPSLHERRLFRNKAKIVPDYHNDEDYHEVNDHIMKQPPLIRPSDNDAGNKKSEDDKDADHHYQRSKDKFDSWDPAPKRSTLDAEVEEILVNGTTRDSSLSSSSRRKINGTSRSGSTSRHHHQQQQQQQHRHRSDRSSESLDRKSSNGHSRPRRSSSSRRSTEEQPPWSEDADDDDYDYDDQRVKSNGHHNNNNNKYNHNHNNNRYDADRFGSLKKKNEKNAGLNFRSIIEKFRTKPSEERNHRSHSRSRKPYANEEYRSYDDDRRTSPTDTNSSPKKKTHHYHDRVKGNGAPEFERKLTTTPDYEDEYRHRAANRKPRLNSDSDSSKRRSYAFEKSPDFDVRIEKYERARRGTPDAELQRRSSFNGSKGDSDGSPHHQKTPSPPRDCTNNVVRKSSLKYKDNQTRVKSKPPKPKVSERHSRPLTPPQPVEEQNQQEVEVVTNFFEELREPTSTSNKKSSFSMKEWYETNRQFAAKYLKEHSKIKELSTSSDVSAKDEFVFGSAKECQTLHEIESLQQRLRNRGTLEDADDSGDDLEEKFNSTSESFVKTVNGKEHKELQNRRASVEDIEEDEEEEHRQRISSKRSARENGYAGSSRDRSFVMPSRKEWNYRDGGVHITDVEDGQPCLQCGDMCSGFIPHTWRKNCTSCKCPREAHDVCHDEWVSVRARLGLKADESKEPSSFDPRDAGLAWAPPGLPAHKVEEYFSMLPEMSVPRLGTSGERHRDRQLATQLPKQDLARAYCRHLEPQHSVSADDFMAARNEIALDIGSVQEVFDKAVDCGCCSSPLKYGSLAVSASKLGQLYHPTCFRCSQCKELLVDLAYCVHDDALYCERHYAEQLKPRCAACDELIFSGEYTKAMNKDWHSGHFCCWQCDESLTGQRYVLRDEHPYCIKCYESVFANGCEECHKIIGIDSKDLSYKDKHWHEACFLCNKCRVSLVDKQFGSKVDKIYCGNCYDAQFASRCDGCGEIFRAGTKKMEYKTRQWHEKCFCCVVCKNPIGTKSFIPREQEIYCAGCYEDKFATRCVKCNKIITSGGVTYKNEPWHRDCFTCSHCDQSLAGQRFTSRDEKPYCADCFGELFAKRCTACTKPITGIGGTRFISFEDRHWHNDCFICAGCKTSLVGRGFITDAEDIICPECAKQKLT